MMAPALLRNSLRRSSSAKNLKRQRLPSKNVHILQMNLTQWCFSHAQHQLPPLFDANISRSRNEFIAKTNSNGSESLHRTRDDDHAVVDE